MCVTKSTLCIASCINTQIQSNATRKIKDLEIECIIMTRLPVFPRLLFVPMLTHQTLSKYEHYLIMPTFKFKIYIYIYIHIYICICIHIYIYIYISTILSQVDSSNLIKIRALSDNAYIQI
jgi:hypothetical protein